MNEFSSAQAAKKLGITPAALSKYIKAAKIPAPRTLQIGRLKVQAWTEAEIEHVRQLLPKIANGRKTRYKKQSAISNQQSAKTKTPARTPVPQKSRKPKKKKAP
jgi:predicted transcriptional regulator